VTVKAGGDRDDGPAVRRVAVAFDELLNGTVGEPLTVANEFTEVVVCRVDTRNGSRLLIVAPKSGQWISLDALEVEALTRQNTRTLAAMVGNVHAPLLPDEQAHR
jgi:hypothetical protein